MIRVLVISPEPTPYRAPLFDLVADLPDIDLTVAYAAPTVAARSWDVDLRHPAVFLSGRNLPLRGLLHHDYPVTPGIVRLLERGRFDVIVVAGWSLFAAQAAVVWCRLRGVPYLLLFESHLLDPRPRWVRALKGVVLPQFIAPAAGYLVTGTLARQAAIRFGADPARVRVFANTIDVDAFAARVDTARERRAEVRAAAGAAPDDVVVLFVGGLDPIKGVDTLVRAVAAARKRGAAALRLVLAGTGEEHESLEREAARLGVPASFLGFVQGDALVDAYAASDIFALLSRSETWGVVVVEAAAAALPLVLSHRVGAAADLLVTGENGATVPMDDVDAAAAAFHRLALDPALRESFGGRARERSRAWGYRPSVVAFAEAVTAAASRRGPPRPSASLTRRPTRASSPEGE